MNLSTTTTVSLQSGVFTEAKFQAPVKIRGCLSLGHLMSVNSFLLNIEGNLPGALIIFKCILLSDSSFWFLIMILTKQLDLKLGTCPCVSFERR